MSHPGVIAVYDAGLVGDRVFVAMELVDGGSLRAWLDQRPRSVRDVLQVFLQAGRGLAAAHRQGLVHRDFKPENVLVGRDGRVRVTDFGLACSQADPEDGAPGVTAGTPAYMAPEQMRGDAASAAADQFSFCVALYEGLYRQRPFQGATLQALLPEVLAGRVRAAPRGSRVPARVRRALARGLASAPAARFSDMDGLLHELDRAPLARRAWLAAPLAAALIGVMVPGLLSQRHAALCAGQEARVASAWGFERRDAARRAFLASGQPGAEKVWAGVDRALTGYAEGWATLHRQACEATRVRGEQSEAMLDLRMQCLESRYRELDALARLLATASADVVGAAPRAAESLPRLRDCSDTAALSSPIKPPPDEQTRQRVERLRAEIAEAHALGLVGAWSQARPAAERAAAGARELGYLPLAAEAEEVLGLTLRRMGEIDRAEATLFEAAWAAEASRHDLVAARAFAELIYVVGYRKARHGEARLLERQTAAILARLGPGHEDVEEVAARHLGAVLLGEGRLTEALAHDARAVALAEKVYGPESQALADCYNSAGVTLNDLGRYPEAARLHSRALEIRERTLGPTRFETATSVAALAIAEAGMGERGQAELLAQRTLKLAEEAIPAGSFESAVLLGGVGKIRRMTGHPREALDLLERAVQIRRRLLGADDPWLASALAEKGLVLHALKQEEAALAAFQEVLQIEQGRQGDDRVALAVALGATGQLLLDRGQPVQALGPLERAVELQELGAPPLERGEALFALARAVASSGETGRVGELRARAQAAFREAGDEARAGDVERWAPPRASPHR